MKKPNRISFFMVPNGFNPTLTELSRGHFFFTIGTLVLPEKDISSIRSGFVSYFQYIALYWLVAMVTV